MDLRFRPTFLLAFLLAPILAGKAPAQAPPALGALPLYFVPNQGQVDDERVSFYVKGADRTLFFTSAGVTIALKGGPQEDAGDPASRWVVKLDFVGARPGVAPVGLDRQAATFSYFTGPREDWHTGLPTFRSIAYRDLWPGIDLVYSGSTSELKYEFIVGPGADPGQIRLAWRGVSGLAVDQSGALHVSTGGGDFEDGAPVAWQDIDGERRSVAIRYALGAATENGTFPCSFEIGAYDHEQTLVLDPAILLFCGYLGGVAPDYGYSIAVDRLGNVYLTGITDSDETSFPVTVGPDVTHNGGPSGAQSDAFVARVNAQGTALDYCGYIGGSGIESGHGIAVDDQGVAYVTGLTSSDESTFPVVVGPDLSYNGAGDAFVARVNAQGTALDYCGYIGGAADDGGVGVALDAFGNAYVTGKTLSDESSFPVLVGPDLSYNGGVGNYRPDVFVARVNARGTALDYCGYIGGSHNEEPGGIAVDPQGNAYVAGWTKSDEASFPVAVGPDLTYNGSSSTFYAVGGDAFVARVNALGTALDYCGYVGGADDEVAYGIDVDSFGNATIAGETASDELSFPVLLGPDLTQNGGRDAFVARVNAAGTALDYCGFIGGAVDDGGGAVALDAQGNAFITGWTYSAHATFPVVVGPDLTYNGFGDVFVARVAATGLGLDYCGYIGGMWTDVGYAIAVDGSGSAYVTGWTSSDEATFPVTAGPDLSYNGSVADAFVAKVEGLEAVRLTFAPDPLVAGQSATFSATGYDPFVAAWLACSLAGPGTTPVPVLNITLGLSKPVQVAGPTITNKAGAVDWSLPIPAGAAGLTVWVQAAQYGKVSNVGMSTIQ